MGRGSLVVFKLPEVGRVGFVPLSFTNLLGGDYVEEELEDWVIFL